MLRYLTGILLLVVALAPLHTASYLWRERLIGEWRGAQARLVEILMDLTVVICISEILGSVSLYRRGPMVIALAVFGMVAIWAARRTTRNRSEEPGPRAGQAQRSEPRLANAAAVVAVSVVIAEWSTQTVAAYHHGMLNTDTLWYHMPFAARFVQDHSITALHYVDAQAVTVFFPASSELIHSLGILLMGNDVLSPLINTLWLGLALLASWCIGRPFGVAAITLTGSAILFATPGLVATQPGGAYDDVVGLAFFLSAVAVLVNSKDLSERSQRVAWVVAAAAAGLAIGTKWTLLGPAAALTVGVAFFVARGRRIRSLGTWLVVLLLTGAFWYVRNLVAVGNPVPPLHLKFGPVSLPSPQLTIPSAALTRFLFHTTDWRVYFLPGLRLSFGPAWWALLGLSVFGLVLAIVTGDRLLRILGFVGLASGVIFVFTPQYLAPVQFPENARYADAAVILGLVLLPINPVLSMWQRARWVLLAYMAVLAASQFDAGIWPTTFFTERFVGGPVRGSDSLIGLLIGVAVLVVGMAVLYERGRTSGRRKTILGYVVIAVSCGCRRVPASANLSPRSVHQFGWHWFAVLCKLVPTREQHPNRRHRPIFVLAVSALWKDSLELRPVSGRTWSSWDLFHVWLVQRVATGNRKRALFLCPHHDKRSENEVWTLLRCVTGDELDGLRERLEGDPSRRLAHCTTIPRVPRIQPLPGRVPLHL